MTEKQFADLHHYCAMNYSVAAWRHVQSVMEYVKQDGLYRFYPDEARRYLCGLALVHDLVDEHICTRDELFAMDFGLAKEDIINLAGSNGVWSDYEGYIWNLMNFGSECAKMVKKADIRDHLMRRDTLTPELQEKYNSVSHYFCEHAEGFTNYAAG